jgi:hypothetical protein
VCVWVCVWSVWSVVCGCVWACLPQPQPQPQPQPPQPQPYSHRLPKNQPQPYPSSNLIPRAQPPNPKPNPSRNLYFYSSPNPNHNLNPVPKSSGGCIGRWGNRWLARAPTPMASARSFHMWASTANRAGATTRATSGYVIPRLVLMATTCWSGSSWYALFFRF